jgi:hypothetical protein
VALGQERFRLWWVQTREELNRVSAAQNPTAVLVLSAALAEAALAFIAPAAKAAGFMKQIDLDDPKSWKFGALIKGARHGDNAADPILGDDVVTRSLTLNRLRQRIHAGFLIDEIKSGPIPDLRPEEAKDGRQTLDMLLSGLLRWLGIERPKVPAKPHGI